VALRDAAVRRGLHVSEYGILDDATGETLRCAAEEDVYARLGLAWIPPELREDRGELQAAADGTLPQRLIEVGDLRGDLHMHTTASDGRNSIEQMALACRDQRGLEYIAITDHSASHGFGNDVSPAQLEQRIDEIHASVEAGAREIDIVITRAHVLTGNWEALYDEVRSFREACGDAHMKSILATGELATLTNVARASVVAMQAGSDFIKTSTGKEGVNATLPFGIVMCRMIREYFDRTGYAIGFKPAGGIRTAKQALEYLYLMKEELGDRWLQPDLFRYGASALLTDIERQLEHFVTGRYSAAHRQPMP
jgi:deoxyribose-phosphate aldolase